MLKGGRTKRLRGRTVATNAERKTRHENSKICKWATHMALRRRKSRVLKSLKEQQWSLSLGMLICASQFPSSREALHLRKYIQADTLLGNDGSELFRIWRCCQSEKGSEYYGKALRVTVNKSFLLSTSSCEDFYYSKIGLVDRSFRFQKQLPRVASFLAWKKMSFISFSANQQFFRKYQAN